MNNIEIEGKQYENRRYSWDELVKLFPSRWVILEDAKIKNSEVVDGLLVGVCYDDNKDSVVLDNINKGNKYNYFRTTRDSMTVGVIGGFV